MGYHPKNETLAFSNMVRLLFSPDRRLPLVPQAKNRVDPEVLAELAEINSFTLDSTKTLGALKGNCDGGAKYLRTPNVANVDCAPGAWPAPPFGGSVGIDFITTSCKHIPNSRFLRKSKGVRRQFGMDLTNRQHSASHGNILASPGIISDRDAAMSSDFEDSPSGTILSSEAALCAVSYGGVNSDDHTDAGKNPVLSTVLEAFESSKQCYRSINESDAENQMIDFRPLRPRRPTVKNDTDPSVCDGGSRVSGSRGVNPRRWHIRSQRCIESPTSRSSGSSTADEVAPEYQSTVHEDCGRLHLKQQWPTVDDVVDHDDQGRSQSVLLTPGAKCPGVNEAVQNTPSAENFVSPQPWIRPPIANPFATPQFTGIDPLGPSNDDVANLLVDLEEIERRVANRTTPSPSPCPGIEPGKCSPTESVLCDSRLSPNKIVVELTLDSGKEDAGPTTSRYGVFEPNRDGRRFNLAVDSGDAEDQCIYEMKRSISRIPEQVLPFSESDISVASTISSLSTSSGSCCTTKVPLLGEICKEEEPSSYREAGHFETTAAKLIKAVVAEDNGSFGTRVRSDEDVDSGGDIYMAASRSPGDLSSATLTCSRQVDRNFKFGMAIIPENQVLISQKSCAALQRNDEKVGFAQDVSHCEPISSTPVSLGMGNQQVDCQGGLTSDFSLERGSATLASLSRWARSSLCENKAPGHNSAESNATSRLGRSVYMDAYGEWFDKQIDLTIDKLDTHSGRRLHIIRSRNLEALNDVVSCPSFDVEMQDNHGNTLFLLVCRAGWRKAVRVLLKSHGADIAATNKYGNCGLHFAKEFGHEKLVAYLLKRSASLAQIKNCRGKGWCERDNMQEGPCSAIYTEDQLRE